MESVPLDPRLYRKQDHLGQIQQNLDRLHLLFFLAIRDSVAPRLQETVRAASFE